MLLNIFDNKVPHNIGVNIWNNSIDSPFRLGWEDTTEPGKTDLNLHSNIQPSSLEPTGILPYFKKCTDETEWFKNKELDRVVLNLVRSNDVHYIHHHPDKHVLLYYVNLDWRDGWYGETLFYDPDDIEKISFTSLYKPGRIILFDGSIPHAIRPQSIKGPKYRFSLSLFFE